MNMKNEFKDKVILVTGGTGTIGSELVVQLLKRKPKQIRVYSRNETSQYFLREKLGDVLNVRMLIGDIRDKSRLEFAMEGVDIVFHAAAMKHVPACEYNPQEVIKTNIIGSSNVLESALDKGVKLVISISTDKVANPVNILGISKLMMEKLFINTSMILSNRQTKFACVRFGNVSWSSGSVLPTWDKQAKADGTIKITDKGMTRFMMSIKEAVELTLRAAELACGGEVFILRMPSIKLVDLASIFLKKYFSGKKIEVKEVGIRGGEKKHEHLFGPADSAREVWADDKMFILLPTADIDGLKYRKQVYENFERVDFPDAYSSEDHLDIEKIKEII